MGFGFGLEGSGMLGFCWFGDSWGIDEGGGNEIGIENGNGEGACLDFDMW